MRKIKLNIDSLSFKREGITVLKDISFDLENGQMLWLQGANGSGKTTILKILAGIIRKFSGSLLFNDVDICNAYKNYVKNVTYIGHQIACWPEKTVIENLKFWARIRQTEELLLATLNFFNLYSVADLPLYKLSSGWKKRTDLARLMIFNSKIWLLDEPMVNLDAKTKTFFNELFNTKLQNGGLIIIASHDELDIKQSYCKKYSLDK